MRKRDAWRQLKRAELLLARAQATYLTSHGWEQVSAWKWRHRETGRSARDMTEAVTLQKEWSSR